MKKTILLLLALLGLSLCAQNANDMILEYEITNPNTTISLPLAGTVNVTVNWGDGKTESFTTGGIKRHSYTTTGIYTVNVSGSLTAYGSESAINNNLTKVKNFGNLGLTSLYYAFYNASNLVEVPTTLPSTVTNLSYMFYSCSKFNFDISSWNTQYVTDISGMFSGASSFNQPIGSWNTQNVTDMSRMFSEASTFNQPIRTWNISKVIYTRSMFFGASLFNQPIGNWDTQNVTDFGGMFLEATSFNQPIGEWNTKNVIKMGGMFWNAISFNQPLDSWNTSKVNDMGRMFVNATAFNQKLGKWDVSSITSNDSAMFEGTALCTDNYDNLLIGWAPQSVKNGVKFHGGNSKFSSASANARATLISKGWSITDGGQGITNDGKCTVTAFNDLEQKSEINLFPNPTTDRFSVDLTEQGTLVLLNVLGQVVLQTSELKNISITDFPSGIYTYHIQTTNKNYTGQLVKE
jgi:surface protein